MKKTITLLTILCLLLSLCTIGASAEKNTVQVTVTIAVKGELVATQVNVQIEDVDGDSLFTVNDALYCAHAQYYQGGAEAGYGYYTGDYGLSMSKLWGDESGAYGYYLNNASCRSLADPIQDGDSITAFVYANADWSDVYTYFDVTAKTVETREEIVLTLMAAGYDENWNPISYPVEGATIMVDGARTGIITDKDGKASFNRTVAGTTVISAISDTQTLVPPVCTVTVVQAQPEGTDEPATSGNCNAFVGTTLVALLPLAYVCLKRKEK